jgi:hypothetical protein
VSKVGGFEFVIMGWWIAGSWLPISGRSGNLGLDFS